MQMRDGAVLPKSCEWCDGRLCCSQPTTALPTISSQPQRGHLSPQQPSTLRKSHTTQWIGGVCSKQSWGVYETTGKFFVLFSHKTASSVPRGGIGNGHFIYGSSGTLQSSVTLFCAWRCWEAHQLPSAPVGCCCAGAHRVNTKGASQPSPKNTNIPFWSHKSSIPQRTCSFLYSAGVPILEKLWFLLLQRVMLIFLSLVRTFQSSRHQPCSTPVEGRCLPSTTPSVCSPERSQHLENMLLFSHSCLEIHLLGWWVFRAFFTVLISPHHFKSTWNGQLELLRWEKMHCTLFLPWYYQTYCTQNEVTESRQTVIVAKSPLSDEITGGQIFHGSAKF